MKAKTFFVVFYGCLLVAVLVVPAAANAPLLPQTGPPPQTLSDGSIVGVPVTGARGVTETVAQIMARQRAADAIAAANPGAVTPRLTKPWLDYTAVPGKRANPDAPAVSQWPPAPAGAAVVGPFNPQTVGTSFLGVQLSESGYIPPDSMGDVGPTQVLMHENGRIKVFDKAGSLGGLNVTDATFWASVTAGISDPEVRYDRLSGRWFILAITIAEATNNKIVVAVSSGATITNQASFTFYSFTVGSAISGDNTNFCDYPSLGVDANALYTGCNMFNSSGAYQHSSVFVIRKSSVTGGGPIVVTGFGNVDNNGTDGPYAPRGVDNDDYCATEGYFIGTDSGYYSKLQIRRVSTPGGTPTLSGNLTLTVATTTAMGRQLHPSNTTQARGLDTVDDRLFQASIHKNKITGISSLWTAHHVEVDATCAATTYNATTARVGARWYEIGALTGTPSVTQFGTLCTTSGTSTVWNSLRGYLFPTVAETGQGHMALGATYAASNPSEYAGVAVAGRLRTDTLGALEAVTLAQTSSYTYRLCDGTSGACPRNRWGDYSFTDVDPNDDMTVWTFQEYANATNSWAVRATQLKAPPPPAATANPTTIPQGATSQTVVCTRTSGTNEFFDPGTESCGGPGWANHISATATNNVAVNSITL